MEFPHTTNDAVAYGIGGVVVLFTLYILADRYLTQRARSRDINAALDGNGAWSGDGSGVFVRRNGNIEFIPESDLDSSVK